MSTDPYLRALHATLERLESRRSILQEKKEKLGEHAYPYRVRMDSKKIQIDRENDEIAFWTKDRDDYLARFNLEDADSIDHAKRKEARRAWNVRNTFDRIIRKSIIKKEQFTKEHTVLSTRLLRLEHQYDTIFSEQIFSLEDRIYEINEKIRDYQDRSIRVVNSI